MKKLIILSFSFCSIINIALQSQENTIKKSSQLSFQSQYFQVKEGANYGLVFHGLNLVLGYEYKQSNNKNIFSYNPTIGFGVDFNKGAGFFWNFKPVDLYYGFRIASGEKNNLYLGPYLNSNYQWQTYSELQGGHLFWFTMIDIGSKFCSNLTLLQKKWHISFSNSIAGLASRPEFETETHFYSKQFSDYLKKAHQDLKFGSLGLMSHSKLEVTVLDINEKRLSIGYAFEYFGYWNNPEYDYLSHSINLFWKLGQNKS